MSTSNAVNQKSKKGDKPMSNETQQESKQPGTSLVVAPTIRGLETGTLATVTDEVSAAFGAEVANQQRNEAPGVTICRIDHKNGVFLINGEPQETVRGYVVHWFQARAWWEKGYKSGENNPPDCSSMDMLKPVAGEKVQAASCVECPLSQFGSGRDGNGQACKVTTFLFLLNPEFGNPPIAALLAPPSSIRNIIGSSRSPGYLGRAKHVKNPKTGKPAQFYELVYTEFSLERGGDLHCVLVPEPLTVAPTVDEARAIAAVRGKMLRGMEELRGRVGQLGDPEV